MAREKQSVKLKQNMNGAFFILRVLLWIPRIKKALVRAVQKTDFNLFQLTEADRYHALFTQGYDFMGQSEEERTEKLLRMHNGSVPQGIEFEGGLG